MNLEDVFHYGHSLWSKFIFVWVSVLSAFSFSWFFDATFGFSWIIGVLNFLALCEVFR